MGTRSTSRHVNLAALLILACFAGSAASNAEEWTPLFDGRSLAGWTPKFGGQELGENYLDTFRVEEGVLKVVYDAYDRFDNKFGHLFYEQPFSHYRLRVEYRFVGEQAQGGPDWALRNSGVMLHCPDPRTMERDQDFPVCVEVQFLGGTGAGRRSTANLCTPSTHVVMNGELLTRHCTNSRSQTYHGDQWVTVEVVVRGGRLIEHIVEGQTVLSYSEPQLDESDSYGKQLLAAGHVRMITAGYIALQAESHPVEFRKVELMALPEE